MKRLCLLSAFLLSMVSPASAQVKVGVKAGATYSVTRLPNFYHYGTPAFKPGLQAGTFIEIPVGRHFIIRPEFLYSVKGWKNSGGYSYDKVRLNYLNLPILLGLKLTPKFTLLFGPEAGNLIGGINHDDDNFERFEMAIVGGLSFQFSNKWSIEGRYSKGISNVLDYQASGGPAYSYKGGTNESVQLSIGLILNKNKQEEK